MRTRSPAAAERSVCLDNVGSFNYFLLKLTSLMRGTTRKTIFCESKGPYELPLLLIPRRHRSSYLKVQAPAHKAAWIGLRMGLCACVCVWMDRCVLSYGYHLISLSRSRRTSSGISVNLIEELHYLSRLPRRSFTAIAYISNSFPSPIGPMCITPASFLGAWQFFPFLQRFLFASMGRASWRLFHCLRRIHTHTHGQTLEQMDELASSQVFGRSRQQTKRETNDRKGSSCHSLEAKVFEFLVAKKAFRQKKTDNARVISFCTLSLFSVSLKPGTSFFRFVGHRGPKVTRAMGQTAAASVAASVTAAGMSESGLMCVSSTFLRVVVVLLHHRSFIFSSAAGTRPPPVPLRFADKYPPKTLILEVF